MDLNCGCPIDLLCERGCGSALMTKPNKLRDIISNMTRHLTRPMTVKMRTGWDEKNPNAHKIIPDIQKISRGKVAAIMIHGRSRLQRYHKLANWEYIFQAANSQNRDLPLIPIIGNGDIMSNADWQKHMSLIEDKSENDAETIRLCSCAMLGRGALIKPWLPKELKDQKDYDISASERLDMLKTFWFVALQLLVDGLNHNLSSFFLIVIMASNTGDRIRREWPQRDAFCWSGCPFFIDTFHLALRKPIRL